MHLSIVTLSIILLTYLHNADSVAVMSIDIGSEWMKVGIVSPGVPMEIALNKESKRKTPAILSFRDNMRLVGEDAQTVGIRFPNNAYSYLLDLLGKDVNHPLVKLYQERFPYYNIVADKERGTVLFKHDEDTYYSPEELIAQLLHRAKEFAEQNARQPIKECVITVPGYFNQIERKALLQAAQLADIKVLQLMNDYMAVALNYGIYRTKDFNETAQYIMFYDMGASSTTATIVSMQNVKTKERGYQETHPQIAVIGVGYDRTLGGLEMQIRLRDHLAKKFNEMKKTPTDVFTNPRSMAKLFKEAGRVKNVLSANSDHYAQIEGLLDEKDFRYQVPREEFETLCADLFDRVKGPVEQALKVSGLTMDIINQVVLVGAGTRVPKVQEKLQEIVKMDLSKNLNTDEAATMGTVYKAADLSTGFQVKKFITKDAVLFPVQVLFERESEDGKKQGKRMLFNLMNAYPQKKIITFNKHVNDFSFNLNYADLEYLSANEILYIGSPNLTQVQLKGVGDALEKNKGENVDTKGIKIHFYMDESGILNLANSEFLFEKAGVSETEEESTISKLGSTISKLFSGSTDEEKPVKEEPEEVPEQQEEVPKSENKTESDNKTDTSAKETPKENKPKLVIVKEPLKATLKTVNLGQMDEKQLAESMKKLKKLDAIDKELNRRATALNNLESFVIDVQTKLTEEEYMAASTQEESEKILASCSEIYDWLYEDGSDADADTYESKLSELSKVTHSLFVRVFEHKERPEALSALNEILNASLKFLDASQNFTKSKNPEKDIYTEVELQTLEKLIHSTEEWRDKQISEQKKLKKNEPVLLTVKSISEKIAALDREMKYLVNKIKMWRPKVVEKPVTEEKIEPESSDESVKADEDVKDDEPTVEESDDGAEIDPSEKLNESDDQHTEL